MPNHTYPEPLATIARMRKEARSERAIAAHLGLTRRKMWDEVTRWNVANPDAPLPRPFSRPATPKYRRAAEMYGAGKSLDEIAAALRVTPERAKGLVQTARTHRLLPLLSPVRDGEHRYLILRKKGGVPRGGTLSELLRHLTPDDVDMLADLLPRNAESLAPTLAHLIREKLRDTHGG
jgi:hypothetical protein